MNAVRQGGRGVYGAAVLSARSVWIGDPDSFQGVIRRMVAYTGRQYVWRSDRNST